MSDSPDFDEGYADKLTAEAVERATRALRAENERLRALLRKADEHMSHDDYVECDGGCLAVRKEVRAALEGQ